MDETNTKVEIKCVTLFREPYSYRKVTYVDYLERKLKVSLQPLSCTFLPSR